MSLLALSAVAGFLLPVGFWLVLSSTARAYRAGAGSSFDVSLLTAAGSAILGWAGFGFALAFGGAPISAALDPRGPAGGLVWAWAPGDVVSLAGLSGFGSLGLSAREWSLWLWGLPFALTAALIIASPAALHRRYIPAALAGLAAGGVFAPLTLHWTWSWGWLTGLGRIGALGHGVLDFGKLTAITAMSAAVGWILVRQSARRPANAAAHLRVPSLPGLALLGSLFVLAGLQFSLISSDAALNIRGLLQLSISVLGAAALAAPYARFVGVTNVSLAAAQAIVAACLINSAGGPVLPLWTAGLIAPMAALCVLGAQYFVREHLRYADTLTLASTLLLPALIGLLLPGLLADGRFGAGLHGVGASVYMNQYGLGITGALGLGAKVADVGQFTAQASALVVLLGLGSLAAAPLSLVLRSDLRVLAEVVELDPAMAALPSEPAAQVSQPRRRTTTLPTADDRATPLEQWRRRAQPAEAQGASLQQMVAASETSEEVEAPRTIQPETEANVTPPADPKPKESALDRFMRNRQQSQPPRPTRAARVAYPVRVQGKSLNRMMPRDPETPAKDAGTDQAS